MPISTTEAIRFALTPGAAEAVESEATRVGNMGLCGMAKGVKHARNALYISVAFTTIVAIGAAVAFFTAVGSPLVYTFTAVATFGVFLTGLTAQRLYEATSSFLRMPILRDGL